MSDAIFTNDLATLAHRLWCESMRRSGWRYGPAFDEDARTHDAMVPFDQLAPHEARSTRMAIVSETIEEHLLALMEYPRGPDREFAADEMRVGLVVEDSDTGEPGIVQSWTFAVDGALDLIVVRWADGEETEIFPPERSIRRPVR